MQKQNITKAKLIRLQSGKTQIELAMETGITPSFISMFERGLVLPTKEKAAKLNQVLGVKVYLEAN